MQVINRDPLGTVEYRRPSTGHSIPTLDVCLGRTDTQEIVPGIAVTQVRYQDFLANVSDLTFGGVLFFPKIGDELERQNGEQYRVVSLGSDSPPYEFITLTKKRVRIHTEVIRGALDA